MKNILLKNNMAALVIMTFTTLAFAQNQQPYSAAQGLDKIKSNFDNSKTNKAEYEKNLNTVKQNINEINKVKGSVVEQKNLVNKEILNNNESLKKVLVQEKEIQNAIKAEQARLQAEAKQMEGLEKVMEMLRQNKVKREEIIAQYEASLQSNAAEKSVWKDREAELRAQEGETIKALRGIASEESNWQNKRKGYEIEVQRWSAESDRQQKIFDTYQGLKNGK